MSLLYFQVDWQRKLVPARDPSKCPYADVWDSVTCDSMLRRYLWTKGNDCRFYELKNIANFSLIKDEKNLKGEKGLTPILFINSDRNNIFAAARQGIESAIRCILGAEVANASWLYFLHYCNAAGGLEPIITADNDNCGQEYKIKVAVFYSKLKMSVQT